MFLSRMQDSSRYQYISNIPKLLTSSPRDPTEAKKPVTPVIPSNVGQRIVFFFYDRCSFF